MKTLFLLLLLFALSSKISFSQEIDKNNAILKNSIQIDDILIQNVKNKRYLGNDSIKLYKIKFSVKKYKIICKKKIPTMFTHAEQKRYRTGTFKYELLILEDNELRIRDTLFKEIYHYLEIQKGITTKNIYLKDGIYLLYINSGDNDYGGYLLYWYRKKVYKIVLTKSRYLFHRNIGGLYNLDINFRLENDVFFPFDSQGVEAYEKVISKGLDKQNY